MDGLGALDTPAAPSLQNWCPAKEPSANASTLPSQGGAAGWEPPLNRIPKPTTVRWIPTTAF